MKFTSAVNAEHPLGKGEVVSSILTGSTIKAAYDKDFLALCYRGWRRFDTEPSTNMTNESGRDPVALFAVRTDRDYRQRRR